MRNAKGMILIAVAAGAFAGCHTAPPVAAEKGVMACGRIADTAERYRCYDSLNSSMRPAAAVKGSNAVAPATASVAAATSAQSTAVAQTAVSTPSGAAAQTAVSTPSGAAAQTAASTPSGAVAQTAGGTPSGTAPQAATAASEKQVGEEYLPPAARPQEAKATTVHSHIAQLNQIRPKIYLIRLANGQVWRHEGINTMIFFNVGDDVTIKRHLFGSYHMFSPATGGPTNWVRVTRIE